MGRWEPDAYGCLYDNKGCFARVSPNKADRLAKRHNADIDALTAERDELKRRLGAVIPEVYVALLDRCYCEEVDDEDFNEQEQCEYCLRIAKLRAIAEGRTA